MRRGGPRLLVALVSGAAASASAQSAAIVGGRVMDQASGLDAVRIVLVEGDRIVAPITPSREPQAYKIKDGVT